MKPEDALERQIERHREMTGEQQLAIAPEMHELSGEVAREGIRAQNPGADEADELADPCLKKRRPAKRYEPETRTFTAAIG